MINNQTKRNVFYYSLLMVTLVPLIGLPALSTISFPFDQSLLLGIAIFAGGFGHVFSTACVYADKSVREVMKPMKLRFYVLPLICLVVTGAALIWGSKLHVAQSMIAGLFIIHLCWLHFHYQRQNYGIVAFIAASTGQRVPRQMSTILLLPAAAGLLAIMPSLVRAAMENESLFVEYQNVMFMLACVLYMSGVFATLYIAMQHREAFTEPRVAIFTILSFLFFAPPIALRNSDYAFWSYALAHGFQYLLMVFTMAGGTGPSRYLRLKIILAFGISVAGGCLFALLLHRLGGNQALFICGIILTWVHFVLDARLWRMSDPGARKLLRERFGFLFS